MTKYYNNTDFSGYNGIKKRRRKNPWVIALKVFCWCIGILAVLSGIAVWIISYYLTPGKITQMIEEKSGEYIHAEVKIGKLDYKLFRTYPWFEFEIDSLAIVSKTLEGISRELRDSLPQDSELLASIVKLKGKVNVHGLLHEDIYMKDIEIVEPKVNIVIVDDSVNNFNILKKTPNIKRVPEIDISEVNIVSPVELSFFSLEDNIEGDVEMKTLYLTKGNDKIYTVGFEGIVDGRYKGYSLPGKIPVKFNTELSLNSPSLDINLNNLSVGVAGVALDAKGEIKINKKEIAIDKANFIVKIEDVFDLLKILPSQISGKIPVPEGLSGRLPINLNLSLMSPLTIPSEKINLIGVEDLPAMTALIKIEDAEITLCPPHGRKVWANDIYLEIEGDYNPENSEQTFVRINELHMNGEGISLSGSAFAGNLTGDEQNVEGEFNFHSPLMESLTYFMPKSGINIAGMLKGDIEFRATAINLGKEGCRNISMAGELTTKSLTLNSSSIGSLKVLNLRSDYEVKIPQYPLSNYAGTKLEFDLSADSVSSFYSGMNIGAGRIAMTLEAIDTVSGTPDPSGILDLKVNKFNFKQAATEFKANGIEMKTKGTLNSSGTNSNYTIVATTTAGEDSIVAKRVSHTPLVLEYEGGGLLQTVMNLLTVDTDFSMQKGYFQTPEYLYPVEISGMELSSNLNRVQFMASRIGLGRTTFAINGVFDGLKPFMTSYSATPLKMSADLNFNDVDINQLSWGYFGALSAQGKDSVWFIPPMTPFTSADSVCVAIPRNIDANIRLNSKRAEYMQYSFSPLSTNIIVKDGAATLSRLTVGAPYCKAIVDWTYSTTQLENIFMDLKADVVNFKFEPFYGVFPQLLEKSPELKNFTGEINADILCRFDMWPNMFMNAESLAGKFDIKASNMKFARQGRIEKITHLMLIEGDEPIQIQNMDITGSYHDNLLQLNPFKINFDEYQLEVAGVNNTSGDMYYHLALEKSPFHLPFGVSLMGDFRHPEIRLGGTKINDYKAEMISRNPTSKIDVNIMAWLKHGWLLFIQEAAKYEEKNEEK